MSGNHGALKKLTTNSKKLPERLTKDGYQRLADQRGFPSVIEVMEEFGLWSAFCRWATGKRSTGPRPSGTPAQAEASLRRAYRAHRAQGKPLRQADYATWAREHPGELSLAVVMRIYSRSWRNACQAAGIPCTRLRYLPGNEVVEEQLRAAARDNGGRLAITAWNRARPVGESVSAGCIIRHYGFWNAALKTAGVRSGAVGRAALAVAI